MQKLHTHPTVIMQNRTPTLPVIMQKCTGAGLNPAHFCMITSQRGGGHPGVPSSRAVLHDHEPEGVAVTPASRAAEQLCMITAGG